MGFNKGFYLNLKNQGFVFLFNACCFLFAQLVFSDSIERVLPNGKETQKVQGKPYMGSAEGFQHPGLSRIYQHSDEHLSTASLFNTIEYASLVEELDTSKKSKGPWKHYILNALCPPAVNAVECKKIVSIVYSNDQRKIAQTKLITQNEKAKLASVPGSSLTSAQYVRFDSARESELKPQITYIPSWDDLKGVSVIQDPATYQAWVSHLRNSASVEPRSFLVMTNPVPLDPNNPASSVLIKYPIKDKKECLVLGKTCECITQKMGELEDKYCYDSTAYQAEVTKKLRNSQSTNALLNQMGTVAQQGQGTSQSQILEQKNDFLTTRNMFTLTLSEGVEKAGFRKTESPEEEKEVSVIRALAQEAEKKKAAGDGKEESIALQNKAKNAHARQIYDKARKAASENKEYQVYDLTSAQAGSSQGVHYSDDDIKAEITRMESEYEK